MRAPLTDDLRPSGPEVAARAPFGIPNALPASPGSTDDPPRPAPDTHPPMRVALVSEHASPLTEPGSVDAGGQNVHVRALALALADEGHDVTVYTRRTSPEQPDRVELAPRVAVEHLAAGPPEAVDKDRLLPYMDELADNLRRSWAARPPDVAHAHFWMSGKASVAAADGLGIPVAQTFHALGVVKKRMQGSADTSPASRLAIERRLARSVDRIVATCADEVRELQALGACDSRISVVPCGVDLHLFTPSGPQEPRGDSRHRLLVVGRLVPRKGVDDAIRALAHVPDAELVVAGGPAPYAVDTDPEVLRLREVAERAGVVERVRFVGQVARRALPSLMRSADLVVCTPWYEPFGMVPLEAMACGVPVVVRPVGGLAETVRDGWTGLHVGDVRPETLGGALAGLLADEDTRRRMAAASVTRARTRYSWRRVARLTTAAYRRCALAAGRP